MLGFRRRIVIACAVAVALGCSDRAVTVPDAAREGGAQSELLPSSTSAMPTGGQSTLTVVQGTVLARSTVLAVDHSASAVIGSGGGVLELPSAGLRVTIPAGALTAATSITVEAPAGALVVYTFLPHGLQFAVPILIEQQLNGTAAENDGGLAASLMGGYLPNGLLDLIGAVGSFTETFPVTHSQGTTGPVAAFSTTHFSGYALASGRTGAEE